MKTSHLLWASILTFSSFAAFACGNSDSSDGGDGDAGEGDGDAGDGDLGDGDGDDACEQGSEGCDCYGNGTCDGDLSCLSDTCVDAGGDGDMGGSSGDGDGDMGGGSGDGDGTGGSAPEVECSRNVECDDDDPCTEDLCIDASCHNELVNALCTSGTCVEDVLGGNTGTACATAYSAGSVELCNESACSGSEVTGCDVEYTFGTATVSVEGDAASRTTSYTLPITDISGSGPLVYDGSNCILTAEVNPENLPSVTVAITTTSMEVCGGEEEVTEWELTADLSPVVFTVTPGDGTTTLCNAVNIGLQTQGIERTAAETLFRPTIEEALNLDTLVSAGTLCGTCSGACEGLSCGPAAPVD